jgi:GH24 family phage-related lysozyme (muramidase)
LPAGYEAYKNNGPAIGKGSKNNNKTPAITEAEMYAMLDKDIASHAAGAERYTTNFKDMTTAGKNAFIDLAFNMGPAWNKPSGEWKSLNKHLKAKNNEGIADSLINSKWYTQVSKRGQQVVNLAAQAFPQVSAADGGAFSGPKSGYTATLHGNEAVIPLKDGAVPVSMSEEFNTTSTNLGELVNILKSNVGVQNQMLAVLDEIRRAQTTTADNTGKMVAMAV